MRRPRRDSALAATAAPARPAVAEPKAGALPRPVRATGLPAGGSRAGGDPRAASDAGDGAETFRRAVAAAKGDDEPPPRQAPYMVAAAILDEWADADTLTPAQLVEAMADRGVTIGQSTAQALLRELRSPLSARMAPRRSARVARPTGTGNGGRPTPRPR